MAYSNMSASRLVCVIHQRHLVEKLACLDDVIILGKNFIDHMTKFVLERCQQFG